MGAGAERACCESAGEMAGINQFSNVMDYSLIPHMSLSLWVCILVLFASTNIISIRDDMRMYFLKPLIATHITESNFLEKLGSDPSFIEFIISIPTKKQKLFFFIWENCDSYNYFVKEATEVGRGKMEHLHREPF